MAWSWLQMALTQVSLKSTSGSADPSQSLPWSRRARTRRPGRRAAAAGRRRRTGRSRTAGRPRRERLFTYHATVWSSSTSALWPPPERSSRACWRSSWCWTIPGNSRCTGRRTVTDKTCSRSFLCVSVLFFWGWLQVQMLRNSVLS